jgi:uncharacterized membrane protein
MSTSRLRIGPVLSAGTLLGVGMGGFVDGIVFHQILQWHHMFSSRLSTVELVSLKQNMLWDGIFHVFTWLMSAVGLALLWRAGRRADVAWSTRLFVGSLLLGWGLFNFVEGLIDHQLLGIHHVRPGEDQLAWDLGFLGSGVLFIALGALLARSVARSVAPGRPRETPTRVSPGAREPGYAR